MYKVETIYGAEDDELENHLNLRHEQGWALKHIAQVLHQNYEQVWTTLVFERRVDVEICEWMSSVAHEGRVDRLIIEGLDAPDDVIPAVDPLLKGLSRQKG